VCHVGGGKEKRKRIKKGLFLSALGKEGKGRKEKRKRWDKQKAFFFL